MIRNISLLFVEEVEYQHDEKWQLSLGYREEETRNGEGWGAVGPWGFVVSPKGTAAPQLQLAVAT